MVASVLDYIPSSFHAAILDGTSTQDVSGYINNGLATQRLLELPLRGQISIGSKLIVYSNGGLLGYNFGCVIKALPDFGDNPMIENATRAPAADTARDRNIILHQIKLHGNKANNSTASEFGHGVQLRAVDGASLDIWVVEPKGDGLSIQQATNDIHWVGCSNITGKVRTEGCNRQGVSIICGEQVDLVVHDTRTNLMSVDIEPDHPQNFIRNIYLKVLSLQTGNGSDISGGVCVAGDGQGCAPTNVIVDFNVFNSGGQGAIWRDAKGLILRGTITSPARNGLVGIGGGYGPSQVSFEDVRVFDPAFSGLSAREAQGSTYDGSISVVGAGGFGAQIENARGGVLQVSITQGRDEGLYLSNTWNMTFPSAVIMNNRSQNVWLRNGSRGNRFQYLKSMGSALGYGFVEDAGCDDNRVFMARLANNQRGFAVSGSSSSVQLEA